MICGRDVTGYQGLSHPGTSANVGQTHIFDPGPPCAVSRSLDWRGMISLASPAEPAPTGQVKTVRGKIPLCGFLACCRGASYCCRARGSRGVAGAGVDGEGRVWTGTSMAAGMRGQERSRWRKLGRSVGDAELLRAGATGFVG